MKSIRYQGVASRIWEIIPWRNSLPAFVVFLLVAVVAQYPGLKAPMYYDSTYLLLGHPTTLSWHDFLEVVNLEPRRLIPMVTFYVNLVLTGEDPLYFRLLSIVILAGTGLMVAFIIRLLLDLSGHERGTTESENQTVGYYLGLIYVLHPVQTYVTLYIWQRICLVSCFFYFASFAAYLAVRMGKFTNRFSGYGLCLVLYLAAMVSKESSLMLPAMLVLLEIVFFFSSWREVAARAGIFVMVTLLVVGLRSIIGHSHLEDTTGHASIIEVVRKYYELSGLSPSEVVLTQCRVVFRYLAIIFLPLPSLVQLVSPQRVSHSLLDPPMTLVCLIGMLGLVALGLYFLRRRPLSGFGILFFLANLVPDAAVVAHHTFFGYRPILPMLGVLMVVADGVRLLLSRRQAGSGVGKGVVAVAVLVMAAVLASTYQRSAIWANPVAFWQNTVDNFPDADSEIERAGTTQALLYLGTELAGQGKGAEAIPYLERVLKLLPNDSFALGALGVANASLGNYPQSEAFFRKALEVQPDLVDAYIQLGNSLLAQGRPIDAMDCYRKGLAEAPRSVKLRIALGKLLIKSGKHSEATEPLNRAVELNDRNYESQYYLGKAFLGMGNIPMALRHLEKAAALKGDFFEAYNDLGVAYGRAGMMTDALRSFQEAVRLNPGDESAAANLQLTLRKMQGTPKP